MRGAAFILLAVVVNILKSETLLQVIFKFDESFMNFHDNRYFESCHSEVILKPKGFDSLPLSKVLLISDFKPRLMLSLDNFHHIPTKTSCATIFIDFPEQLQAINMTSLDVHGHYVVVIEFDFDMESIFKKFWKKSFYNVDVVRLRNSSQASLFTFKPFNGSSCNDVRPIEINSFNGSDWATANFFLEKLKNLEHCAVRFGTVEALPGMDVDYNEDGIVLRGINGDMINILSEKLNFHIDATIDSAPPKILANGSITGLYAGMLAGKIDVVSCSLPLLLNRIQLFGFSRVFFTDKIILIISPSTEITGFRKLLLPFKSIVWFAVLFVVVVAFAVISALKRFRFNLLRNLVVGNSSGNHNMNILIAFIGGSQPKLPRGNFPRFLLMMLLIFCLVIRSAFQGALFKILKSNIYDKEPLNFDELIEDDYELYIFEGYNTIVDSLKYYQR